MTEFEQRISQLEALEAIRNLKSEYLAACDAKKPEAVRACFADGKIHIDYGAVGLFDNADDLVSLYTQAACHPHMVEMHHASNPRLQVIDEKKARGLWALQYQCINTKEKTLTQLGGEYDDTYQRTDSGWKIISTTFKVTSTLVVELGDQAMKSLVADRQPATA